MSQSHHAATARASVPMMEKMKVKALCTIHRLSLQWKNTTHMTGPPSRWCERPITNPLDHCVTIEILTVSNIKLIPPWSGEHS